MAKIKKPANGEIPARAAGARHQLCESLAGDLFTDEKQDFAPVDVALLGTAIEVIGTLLARDWNHLQETANDRGEGEVVATLRVNFPFGKQEQEIHTQISFGGKKFTDEDKVKVDDPKQGKLDLEHAGRA